MKIQWCLWNEGQESSKQLVQALPLLFYIYLRTAFPAFLHIHWAFGLFTQWKIKMIFCYFCRHCFVRKYMKNLQGFFYFYLFFTWIRNFVAALYCTCNYNFEWNPWHTLGLYGEVLYLWPSFKSQELIFLTGFGRKKDWNKSFPGQNTAIWSVC